LKQALSFTPLGMQGTSAARALGVDSARLATSSANASSESINACEASCWS
jgi:hypothetical protein